MKTFIPIKIKYNHHIKDQPEPERKEGIMFVRPETVLGFSNDAKAIWVQGIGSYELADDFVIDENEMQMLSTSQKDLVDELKKQIRESGASGGLF